ncbi:hypothetical protein CC86DRAFT_408513 [Ophiobolus disseminans]|uniref:RanBP2-type domain-containing protein n=1 Tax=Ophiobolus disseminans TaxID=1469910 RepID=A0A6A6ZUE9_9PLEO|nr:hypothetical protein CC86DRAFT_408513 [Ophiobolus disseminans]
MEDLTASDLAVLRVGVVVAPVRQFAKMRIKVKKYMVCRISPPDTAHAVTVNPDASTSNLLHHINIPPHRRKFHEITYKRSTASSELLKQLSDTEVNLFEDLFAVIESRTAGQHNQAQLLEVLGGCAKVTQDERDGLIRERCAWGREEEKRSQAEAIKKIEYEKKAQQNRQVEERQRLEDETRRIEDQKEAERKEEIVKATELAAQKKEEKKKRWLEMIEAERIEKAEKFERLTREGCEADEGGAIRSSCDIFNEIVGGKGYAYSTFTILIRSAPPVAAVTTTAVLPPKKRQAEVAIESQPRPKKAKSGYVPGEGDWQYQACDFYNHRNWDVCLRNFGKKNECKVAKASSKHEHRIKEAGPGVVRHRSGAISCGDWFCGGCRWWNWSTCEHCHQCSKEEDECKAGEDWDEELRMWHEPGLVTNETAYYWNGGSQNLSGGSWSNSHHASNAAHYGTKGAYREPLNRYHKRG